IVMAVAVLLTAWLVPTMNVFGNEVGGKKQLTDKTKQDEAKRNLEKALATVNSIPKAVADEESVKLAKQELETLLKQPIKDPAQANRSALKALQDVNDAIKQQIKDNQKFATAQNDAKMFRGMAPPADEKGPVADAQRSLAKGDFAQAIEDVKSTVEKFDKMDEKEKEKAAEQMKQ